MECRDFESMILDVAREGLTLASAHEGAIAHAESCSRCKARLRDERALTAGLVAMAERDASCEAPPRVEDALVALFRESAGGSVQPKISSRRARWIRVAAAAAAAIIIIAAIVASRHQSAPPEEAVKPDDPVQEQPSIRNERKKKLKELAPVIAGRKDRRNNPRQRKVSNGKPDRAATSQTEIATDFFPLVDYDNLINFDSGEIRRVTISRPALVSLGLPVNMDLANEPVKADVLVGHDGLARAIRFVR